MIQEEIESEEIEKDREAKKREKKRKYKDGMLTHELSELNNQGNLSSILSVNKRLTTSTTSKLTT